MTNPHIHAALANSHAEDLRRAATRAAQRELAIGSSSRLAVWWRPLRSSFFRRATGHRPHLRTQI